MLALSSRKPRDNEQARPSLLILTTTPAAMRAFFSSQIKELHQNGIRVYAATSPGHGFADCAKAISPVPLIPLPMMRRISLIRDAISLIRMAWLFMRLRPDVVHTYTPKAGLLGMISGFATRVPVRIYQVNGLPLMTRSGFSRQVLVFAEKVSCLLAHQVFCDSASLMTFVVRQGMCSPAKISTVWNGSSFGIDLKRFDSANMDAAVRDEMRFRLGVPSGGILVSFIGRVVRDKGSCDLAAAWALLRAKHPSMHLLICGVWEAEDATPESIRQQLKSDSRVHMMEGSLESMPSVYFASDIVVLPTYREGLPNVALEAAAMNLPIVTTRIPGCIDAVDNNKTGLLVETGDPQALANATSTLAESVDLRISMGSAARKYVEERFDKERFFHHLLSEYDRLLIERGLSRPQFTTSME